MAVLGSGLAGCALPNNPPRAPQVPEVHEREAWTLEPSIGRSGRAPSPVPARCRQNMVRVGSFCIDQYEGSVMLSNGELHPHNRPVLSDEITAASLRGVFPQGHISQVRAGIACRNAGKRLCTKAEWQTACMGRGETVFPYGDRHIQGNCNLQRLHPPSELFGSDYRNHLNDPGLNLLAGGLARTGSHPNCTSDYGAFDMVGNLHEWVSDIVLSAPHAGNGIFMGGFYSNFHENGYGCNYTTTAHDPHHYDYSTGLRCCEESRK